MCQAGHSGSGWNQTGWCGLKLRVRFCFLKNWVMLAFCGSGDNRHGKSAAHVEPNLAKVSVSNLGAPLRERAAQHLVRVLAVAIALYGCSLTGLQATPLPPESNVLNVKQFGAKGDGIADDTAAIRATVDQLPPFDAHHPFQTRIIYLPDGTYLIRDTIQRRNSEGQYQPGLVMIGQSRKGTVIKLADNSPGFQDRSAAKAMIFTASGLLGRDPRAGGKDPALGEGNDAYVNTLENLTLEVGQGNPGAVALDYLANNIGAVRDVTIRAKGRARTGLLMTRKWIGPALIQRVSISGFDVGIDVSRTEYSVTLDGVSVHGSREFGLRNDSNSIPFHDLAVEAEGGVGIANIGQQALLAGIKAKVSGRGEAAFQNTGSANLQDFSMSGFVPRAGRNAADRLDGVFDNERRIADSRWSLPIRSISNPDERSSSEWVNVQSFGAKDDKRVDSTNAINAAFRSGARTIFFPTGIYKISGSIAVPPTVEKIEGLFSTIVSDHNAKPYVVFFTEPRSKPLVLRRLIVESRAGPYAVFEQRASAPVLLQDIVGYGVGLLNRLAEGGDVVAENISTAGRNKVAGPAGAWFKQLNIEARGTVIENDGAPLWILGAKTEQTLTLVHASNNATTEIVGGLIYRVNPGPELPFLISENSRLVASYAEEAFRPTAVYSIHVQSQSGDQQNTIPASDLPLRGQFGRMVQQIFLEN